MGLIEQLELCILKAVLSRINFENRVGQNIPLQNKYSFCTNRRGLQHLAHSCRLYTRYFTYIVPLPPKTCSFLPLANEKNRGSVVCLRWENSESIPNLFEVHGCVLLRTRSCLSNWNPWFFGPLFMGLSASSPSVQFTVLVGVLLLRLL